MIKSIVLSLLISGSAAIAQPMSLSNLTCGSAQTLLDSYGSLIVAVDPYNLIRVVKFRSFCDWDQKAEPAFMPALDTPVCNVGYTCHGWYNSNGG